MISPNKIFLEAQGSFGCEVVSLQQILDYGRSKTCALYLRTHSPMIRMHTTAAE